MIPVIKYSSKALYLQIYDFYKEAILQNRMREDEKLLSYRKLASTLGVANNTVLRAYEQLVMEGYVRNESKRGLFVNKIEVRDWQIKQVSKKKFKAKKLKLPFSASIHLVDQTHFPVQQWRKCSNWAIDKISFQYQEYEDDEPLKEQLLEYLFRYRGVTASPAQVLIGSGVSALIFWLAFVLRHQCRKIVVEDPGYTPIINLFKDFDYQIKPICVTKDGIDVAQLHKEQADLLYLTPSHQFPTGAAIPVNERLLILEWAKKNNAYVIEDDFDCEFRYKVKLMPSLQALDNSGRIIYVGTFSNVLMPSLRVAYVILPKDFPAAASSFKYLTNTVPHVTRRTLSHFMANGFWEGHLRKMSKLYKLKYDTCIRTLNELPPGKIKYNNTPSGLNILLTILSGLSEKEIVRRALGSNVPVTPASQFYADPNRACEDPQILFEFGSIPLEKIDIVILKLYAAWFQL